MSLNHKILKNDLLDKELLEMGYVVIPFLNEEEKQELKSFYYQHHLISHEGMYATAHGSDISVRIKMNDFIKGKFARAIYATFHDCRPLGGSYIAKGKGEKGILTPHQDWNIVDEDKYRSFNIWVPLVDLTDENGVICIMPQSHTWRKTYRSANISSAYQDREEEFWKTMKRLYMKNGEALIYDHRLIHASGVNNTEEIRLACVYGIIPEGADMFYYHQKDDQTIEVYKSSPDFFLYGNIFEGPKGLEKVKSIKIIKETKHIITKIFNFIGSMRIQSNK